MSAIGGENNGPEIDDERKLVMIDWSRENNPTSGHRRHFLWQQMVLSLLYDNVVAQDETIVCSPRMARWFRDDDSFHLLEQLFLCGGIGVLKRPWARYPTDELRALARQDPIAARRIHLENYSVNNDGEALKFDEHQVAFHSRLERLLNRSPRYHRFAGSQARLGTELMPEFAGLLGTVLTDRRYKSWLQTRFKSITPAIANEFVGFITHPDRAVAHVARHRAGQMPKFTPEQDRRTVFTTALAVQVAATYQPHQARALQSLIETVFARPFCQDEGADGRYGKLLRDLPTASDEDSGPDDVAQIHRVEVDITVPVHLPSPTKNFGEAIQRVRESKSGANLRRAMRHLETDLTFTRVRDAWTAVAHELAPLAGPSGKTIPIRMLVASTAREIFRGVTAEFLVHSPDSITEALKKAAGPTVGGVMGMGGELFTSLRNAELRHQQQVRTVEELVDFRCVQHPTIKSG